MIKLIRWSRIIKNKLKKSSFHLTYRIYSARWRISASLFKRYSHQFYCCWNHARCCGVCVSCFLICAHAHLYPKWVWHTSYAISVWATSFIAYSTLPFYFFWRLHDSGFKVHKSWVHLWNSLDGQNVQVGYHTFLLIT